MQRILAIDDDPSVTSLLKRGLAYEGYAVDSAASGEAGLSLAREHAPDLVVLDIMMPGMSGLEVLQRLRAADARLPVIMLTAKDAPADQVRPVAAMNLEMSSTFRVMGAGGSEAMKRRP